MRQQFLDLLDIQNRRRLSVMVVLLAAAGQLRSPHELPAAILLQVSPERRHNPVRRRCSWPETMALRAASRAPAPIWTWSAMPTWPPRTAKSSITRTARDADLGDQHAMPADLHIVADLDQIIDLAAFADHRVAQRAAVDGGAGADLDTVLDDDAAQLRNLDMARRRRGKAETGLADLRARQDRSPGRRDRHG